MGKQKSEAQVNETKVTQAKRTEEQLPLKKPAEAISRLEANVAQPGDVKSLQRTLGNKAVSNMIQRHAVSSVSVQYEDGETSAVEPAPSGGTQSDSGLRQGLEESGGGTQSEQVKPERSPATQGDSGLRHELEHSGGETRGGSEVEESGLRQEAGNATRSYY